MLFRQAKDFLSLTKSTLSADSKVRAAQAYSDGNKDKNTIFLLRARRRKKPPQQSHKISTMTECQFSIILSDWLMWLKQKLKAVITI